MQRGKGVTTVLAAGGLALVAATAVQAQDGDPGLAVSEEAMQAVTWRAGALVNKLVKNPQGEALGEIEEILIDKDGRVRFVVLSHGGFIGLGDKLTAVPFDRFEMPGENGHLTMDVSKEGLEQAPHFEEEKWPNLGDKRWVAESGKGAGFSGLDKDNDGFITRSEADRRQDLSSRFQMVDRNDDGRIDASEFSAFESGGEGAQKPAAEPKPPGQSPPQ